MKLEQQKLDRLRAVTQLCQETDMGPFRDIFIHAIMNNGDEVTCEEFVKNYLESNRVVVKPNGIYKDGDLVRNHKAFFHKLHQAYKHYKSALKLKNSYSREEITAEVEVILDDNWDADRKALRAQMEPIDRPGEFDRRLTELANALCGHMVEDKSHVEFRLAKAFIAHFYWQIMMRLHHGPQAVLRGGNQAVLMLVSPKQKTGKSTAVRYMIQAFENMGFVWRATLDRLSDQFSYGNLAYNYVAFFDDMHRSSKLNMGSFKQIVTQDEVHFRSMHTQTEMKLPQVATLIATSNKSPRELMNDTTGLRRFHQLKVNNGTIHSGAGIDLDFIAQFDFVEFARMVPLSENTPLFNYVTEQELSAYEESIRPMHVVEHWLSAVGYEPACDTDPADLMSLNDMFAEMRMWASENGYQTNYIPTSVSLSTKLQELGYLKGRTSKFRGFYVTQGVSNDRS